MARKNPIAKVANYAAPVDSTDMDDSMKGTMFGTPMTKEEAAYVAGTNRPSAREAVRRVRRANKQPPVQE